MGFKGSLYQENPKDELLAGFYLPDMARGFHAWWITALQLDFFFLFQNWIWGIFYKPTKIKFATE